MFEKKGDREKAKQKLLEAKRLQALLDKEQEQNSEREMPEEVETVDEPKPRAGKKTGPSEQETIEEMRALIREWETQRTESARGVVNPED